MLGISFHYPQLLVLLLLLPLFRRRLAGGRGGVSAWLRLAIAVLAILALSRPRFGMTGGETDLILVVDRSASASARSEPMLRELLALARREEKTGDRTAVIAFGDGAIVERGFSVDAPGSPPPDNFAYASDLSAALRMAADIRSPERRTAILCLSDGLYTGDDPLGQDVVSAFAPTPFWYRHLGADAGVDVAAGAIILPEEVEPRSAWAVRYTIIADAPCETEYALSRNGLVVAGGGVTLRRGQNHFFVRDTVGDDPVLEYRLETRTPGDPVAQNNVSRAVLRVRTPPRTLLVSHDAAPGIVASSLEAAAIPVDVIEPRGFPTSAALLSPYRLVILENCQLSAFPSGGARALASAVEAGNASLLVTGGLNSFGMGGYHRSAIDPLLPVEMELRNDVRRGSMAIAIALDRSGSMAVPVADGLVKMDLANRGAAEAIGLLSIRDQVSVIAVDSSPHIIVPLAYADDIGPLVGATLRIQSMGGGIYCFTALKAAAGEVRKSTLLNRNIILFADASDAEEQEGCMELARELLTEGIRISVVAMGTESDSDAGFLKALAAEGGGEALFSNAADGLPALFSREVVRISRRGFIEEPVTPRLLSSMHLLGLGELDGAPELLGYNVSALRDGSVPFMNMNDEFNTPLLATRQRGRTMTGAVLFEIEGEFSGGFQAWRQTPGLVVALARRLAGGSQPAGVKAYSSMDRGVAEAWFEFTPAAARAARGETIAVRWLGPGGVELESDLEWVEPERARVRVSPRVPGHYLPVADLGALGVADGPAVSLSFSPEFDLRDRNQGREVLDALSRLTGGGDSVDVAQVRMSAKAAGRGAVELRPWLLGALLLLFLLELAGRRLLLFR